MTWDPIQNLMETMLVVDTNTVQNFNIYIYMDIIFCHSPVMYH